MTLTSLIGKKVHFIGIGGSGMSGIARIMLAEGVLVTGSDAKGSAAIDSLAGLGAQVFIGQEANHVVGAHLVVASGAISESNPELAAARDLGIPVIFRAQALAMLMAGKESVAVAGTHGKTTTTSMLTVALQVAGKDPSFAIGGMINSSGVNAHRGSGSIFVAEADESDGSFTVYHPLGAIITNIELDHVDHFATLAEIDEIFHDFVATIAPGGFLVACIDDPGVARLLAAITRSDITIYTYGEGEADFQISRIALLPDKSFARVSKNGTLLPELQLVVPGKHNVLNATAALAAGIALGVSAEDMQDGLQRFTGSRRRFEHKGKVNDIEVIDDYGHHPTEIEVVLQTARRYVGAGRVIVIFQPHRYSRTQAFATQFATALGLADHTYILEIYAASEAPIPGVSSLLISREMPHSQVSYEPSMVETVNRVVSHAKPGDLIITLGAGDVSSLAPLIVDALTEAPMSHEERN